MAGDESQWTFRGSTTNVSCPEKNIYSYMYISTFVDLEKAFDNVHWDKMFDILKRPWIKYNYLYKNQIIQFWLDWWDDGTRIGERA